MKWLLKESVLAFIRNWPIIFRASLYFWGAFLAVLSEKLAGILFNDVWPSPPYTWGALMAALAAALIALRAFYDGAAQRHSDSTPAAGEQTTTRTEVQQTAVTTSPAETPKTP